MNAPATEALGIQEAVRLGAVDGSLYGQFFFPRALRQSVPMFHRDIWGRLDDPEQRYVAVKVFRDGAKTTLLRVYTSRRIAYGISRNVVYTSNSEAHAVRSISWLKRQITYNRMWAETFGLRRGAKWSENEIEIIHSIEDCSVFVLAVGITGQVRGINFDDYRPDLVVGDDVDNEETTGTPEQRKKSSDLFFGALIQGLAAPTDSPLAKAVLLATPLAKDDLIDQCSRDPSWSTASYGCFDEHGESRWADKFPTEFLKKEKIAYAARNQLSLWMREKECRIVAPEMAAFRSSWLNYWDVLPEGIWFRISIDPAFSDSKTADQLAMTVVGFKGSKRFLADLFVDRGVMPDAVVAQLFTFIKTYQPREIVVETNAYQKALKWYIEQEMQRQRLYRPVHEYRDKRNKSDRILQAFLACAPHGELYVHRSQTGFLEQYESWYAGYSGHDDILDAVAMALAPRGDYDDSIEGEFERIAEEEADIPSLGDFRQCP